MLPFSGHVRLSIPGELRLGRRENDKKEENDKGTGTRESTVWSLEFSKSTGEVVSFVWRLGALPGRENRRNSRRN